MNTTLTTTGRPTHPPQPGGQHVPVTRRVGVVDRAALHLGVALIRWGRRPVAGLERRASRIEHALMRREVDRQLERERSAALLAAHRPPMRLP